MLTSLCKAMDLSENDVTQLMEVDQDGDARGDDGPRGDGGARKTVAEKVM